jgi:hypothetical protein
MAWTQGQWDRQLRTGEFMGIAHWVMAAAGLVSTALAAGRLPMLIERNADLRAAVRGQTARREYDFRGTLIGEYSVPVQKHAEDDRVKVLIVVGANYDWYAPVVSVVDAAATFEATQRQRIAVTLVSTADVHGAVAESLHRTHSQVSVSGIADPASFARHTGIEFVPCVVILDREAEVVAVFDGAMPSASELHESLTLATTVRSQRKGIVVRRGVPVGRFAPDEQRAKPD